MTLIIAMHSLHELGAMAEGYPDDPFVQEVWRQLVEAMGVED